MVHVVTARRRGQHPATRSPPSTFPPSLRRGSRAAEHAPKVAAAPLLRPASSRGSPATKPEARYRRSSCAPRSAVQKFPPSARLRRARANRLPHARPRDPHEAHAALHPRRRLRRPWDARGALRARGEGVRAGVRRLLRAHVRRERRHQDEARSLAAHRPPCKGVGALLLEARREDTRRGERGGRRVRARHRRDERGGRRRQLRAGVARGPVRRGVLEPRAGEDQEDAAGGAGRTHCPRHRGGVGDREGHREALRRAGCARDARRPRRRRARWRPRRARARERILQIASTPADVTKRGGSGIRGVPSRDHVRRARPRRVERGERARRGALHGRGAAALARRWS